MKFNKVTFWSVFLFFVTFCFSGALKVNSADKCSDLLNTVVKDIEGQEINLCKYHGKVLLIVNTASKCGFTGQYAELEKLYQKYKEKGFEVLAFPSNDFANQEPLNDEQIKKFCNTNYQTSFSIFAKVKVRGKEQSPLYEKLSSSKGGVQWNFQKYLVNKKGQVVKKFAPWVSPSSQQINLAIEEELKK